MPDIGYASAGSCSMRIRLPQVGQTRFPPGMKQEGNCKSQYVLSGPARCPEDLWPRWCCYPFELSEPLGTKLHCEEQHKRLLWDEMKLIEKRSC